MSLNFCDPQVISEYVQLLCSSVTSPVLVGISAADIVPLFRAVSPDLSVDGEREGIGCPPLHGEGVLDALVRDLHRELVHAFQPDQTSLFEDNRWKMWVRLIVTSHSA